MNKILNIILLSFSLLLSQTASSNELPVIRIGILAFGTTNWELAALENLKLLENAKFKLEIHKLANPQASKMALQANSVDIIISDWLWVSRMRTSGSDFSFYPYSTASGALLVANNSNIKSLKDLRGKLLGIAGDSLDRNWLLLQALTKQEKFDISNEVKKSFGAPPLLSQQLLDHRLDAVLTYWHYAAQLEPHGYRALITGTDILKGLGIQVPMANIGYVFKQSWADAHKEVLADFIKLTEQTRNQLCDTDSAWQTIIPLLKTADPLVQSKLHQAYCEGRIREWGKVQFDAADKIFSMIHQVSGNQLTGNASAIQPGTFWLNQ
jgi:NitT/TauT family transport system substrate-binding protein